MVSLQRTEGGLPSGLLDVTEPVLLPELRIVLDGGRAGDYKSDVIGELESLALFAKRGELNVRQPLQRVIPLRLDQREGVGHFETLVEGLAIVSPSVLLEFQRDLEVMPGLFGILLSRKLHDAEVVFPIDDARKRPIDFGQIDIVQGGQQVDFRSGDFAAFGGIRHTDEFV